jgi:flagellar basal body-associated protein FliL
MLLAPYKIWFPHYNGNMKRVEERPPQTLVILYRALIIAAALLLLILLIGTVYGLAKKNKAPADPELSIEPSAGGDGMFTGLGTMRITTADPEPETLVISVAFPYDKNDRPFSEELASRISFFKTSTAEYLGAFTAEELAARDMEAVNGELLRRYNSALSLGQIKELYILDFMRL